MDNLTHSLVGALLGQAGLKRRTGLAMPALMIGANLPDFDAGCTLYGLESLAMRRGLTHGPLALILLPIMLSAFLWWFDRWQSRRGTRPESRLPVRFGWLLLLSFVACLSHPALDWLNSYGIRLLEPFSSRWYYGDALFIADIWMWAAMGLALFLSLRAERRGNPQWRRPALIGIAAVLAYINANIVISASAVAASPQRGAIAVPLPVAFWQRDLIVDVDGPIYLGLGRQRWSLFGGMIGEPQRLTDRPACIHPLQLPQFAPTDRALAAFLFWSRTPYVERQERDGQIVDVLFDARFEGDAASRFQVKVPVPREAESCLSE